MFSHYWRLLQSCPLGQADALASSEGTIDRTEISAKMKPRAREIGEQASTHILTGTVTSIISSWEDSTSYSSARVEQVHWVKGEPVQEPVLLKYG